jgi:hypothetical protein
VNSVNRRWFSTKKKTPFLYCYDELGKFYNTLNIHNFCMRFNVVNFKLKTYLFFFPFLPLLPISTHLQLSSPINAHICIFLCLTERGGNRGKKRTRSGKKVNSVFNYNRWTCHDELQEQSRHLIILAIRLAGVEHNYIQEPRALRKTLARCVKYQCRCAQPQQTVMAFPRKGCHRSSDPSRLLILTSSGLSTQWSAGAWRSAMASSPVSPPLSFTWG